MFFLDLSYQRFLSRCESQYSSTSLGCPLIVDWSLDLLWGQLRL